MDGYKHDETTSLPQESCHQEELLNMNVWKNHAREQEVGDLLLESRFKQAFSGNIDAQAFFYEALQRRYITIQIFLEKKAAQETKIAVVWLQGYYLSLLISIRV